MMRFHRRTIGNIWPPTINAAVGLALLPAGLAGLGACERASQNRESARTGVEAREVAVVPIPLDGPMMETCGDRCAELSGLAWHGDMLLLLPQYPRRFSSEADGCLLAIRRAQIEAVLAGRSSGSVAPEAVRLVASGLRNRVEGFQGYESIAIRRDRVYMTIESAPEDPSSAGSAQGYVVAGSLAPDSSVIYLDIKSLTQLPSQTQLGNMSYEALVEIETGVLAIHEANGKNLNPAPKAYWVDPVSRRLQAVSFPALEYRVTDATSPDEHGRFWVINYFWPGEENILRPNPDALVKTYGIGPSHARSRVVERLVELRWSGSSVVRTDTAPIQLELLGEEQARNWEGIVRLGEQGFLLVTDRFPSTMFGFVPAESATTSEH